MNPNLNIVEKFQRRLKQIGVSTEMGINYPWIYLTKVNGNVIKEKYMADHGFTAFWFPVKLGNKTKFTDRRKVFAKVRQEFSK